MRATRTLRPERRCSSSATYAATRNDEAMFTRRIFAVLSSVLLLTAACGNDSSEDTSEEPSEEPSSSTDDTRSDTFDADLEVAEAAVLNLDDLPVGWSSKARDDDDDDDDEFDQEIADCLGVPVEEVADSGHPKAESETFVGEDDTEVEAEIVMAPTVEEAIADFEQATSDEFLQCIREVLPAVIESAAAEEGGEFELGEASVGPLRVEETGDRSGALRLTIAIEAEGMSVDAYFDILFAQVGRATMQLSAASIFAPADVESSQALLATMVDRIDAQAVS